MKKLVSIITILAMLVTLSSFGAAAEAANENVTPIELPDGIYYFEDGSYIITEPIVSAVQPLSDDYKTYGKMSTYYNSDDVAQCSLEVIGTFEVNYRTNVRCTNVVAKTYVYVDGWTVENVTKSCTSGFRAIASATASGDFVKRSLGLITKTVPVTVTVTCDKNGN